MNKKSLIFGIAVTLVWLTIIVLISIFGDLTYPLSLNELGDFLAGIFAPVAFFWLILGYIQQGKQLDQNTQALEQQEQALQLQIKEMRETVQQQGELVLLQKQQNEDSNNSVAPFFNFSDLKIHCFGVEYINGIAQELDYELTFKLSNIGKAVRDATFLNKNNEDLLNLMRIVDENLDISISLSRLGLEWIGNSLMTKISIKYKNSFGRIEKNIFLLKIIYEDAESYEIDNPIRIYLNLSA